MSFVKGNISQKIEEKRKESPDFRKAWDESREEYRLIGEMISIRKKRKNNSIKIS